MLREADALIDIDEISQAYELLMEVERMAPGWKQASPRFAKLLIKEAEINLSLAMRLRPWPCWTSWPCVTRTARSWLPCSARQSARPFNCSRRRGL